MDHSKTDVIAVLQRQVRIAACSDLATPDDHANIVYGDGTGQVAIVVRGMKRAAAVPAIGVIEGFVCEMHEVVQVVLSIDRSAVELVVMGLRGDHAFNQPGRFADPAVPFSHLWQED